MDGFERELRAYSGMGAAYQGDKPSLIRDNRQEDKSRDCIDPLAETLLHNLSSLPRMRGKLLMSTRLRPRPVELRSGGLLQGCVEHRLTEMQPDDAIDFFHCQGIQGSRGEIEQACGNYGFHPLSLRLLAGYVAQDFEYPRDIRAAANLDLTGDLVQRRNHVLKRSYESLSAAGQQLLGQIACFRNPVAYGALAVIEQGGVENSDGTYSTAMALQVNLRDLINRGLLQQDTRTIRQDKVTLFDLHPIVRGYAYARMTIDARTTAHSQLRDYFAAVPIPEKVTALDDLVPSIELYHHMVRAGQYDEACYLFVERINKATYYQLGAYQLRIELLSALFPQGEEQPPKLQEYRAQAWTLNVLANSYSLNGQPRAAVRLFELAGEIHTKRGDKTNLIITLENLAHMAQLLIGALKVSESNLCRAIDLCQEIEEEYDKAIGHAELGRLLAYKGAWATVEVELDKATELFSNIKNTQYLGITYAYRSLTKLLRVRAGELQEASTALAMAIKSLELADKDARAISPIPRDYVRIHWLMGVAYRVNGNLLQSDTYLSDSLTRCRTINLIEFEADILLDLARLRADQGQPAEAQRLAQEALTITERSGYVLQGADVRLFLAQQALGQGDRPQAFNHAQLARQLATCDGGDYVYRVAYDEAGALLTQLSL
jgi:tetratricopeptide (TPR) repeat protein